MIQLERTRNQTTKIIQMNTHLIRRVMLLERIVFEIPMHSSAALRSWEPSEHLLMRRAKDRSLCAKSRVDEHAMLGLDQVIQIFVVFKATSVTLGALRCECLSCLSKTDSQSQTLCRPALSWYISQAHSCRGLNVYVV